ncbi:hypothetical protein T440DRAFT_523241 [Plenodomus tracheiphilus IPT5]|uniref:DUF3295 domain-containing protein n=1 Tax=Plenodomus tracheiphilus IPT5 TaxID=1408161 RepID=A0A6A7ANN9_9PLEO|nr:hypothetical protein T440DRAFT_523241 [Plenodomus tracheiphilus IPT5]
MSPAVGSEASTSTNVSRHNVVRGFKPGHISTSVRPLPAKADASKDQPMFTLEQWGCHRERSEDDDDDESAFEEEDSDEEWEDDDNEESGPPSVAEHRSQFPRVDSQANLTSRRSLLTNALHQGDRASRSSIRSSRTYTSNASSAGSSPHEDSGLMMLEQASRPKPIIMTTSNRADWKFEAEPAVGEAAKERHHQRGSKRQQSAINLPALRRAKTTGDVKGLNTNKQIRSITFRDDKKPHSSYNRFFYGRDASEYHRSGW